MTPDFDVRTLDDPLARFTTWWGEAHDDKRLIEPAAMCLATVDADGRPAARIVLLRAFDERGFVFYTNRTSKKGRDLDAHKDAALCIHWMPLHRQVRVEGAVVTVDDAEADAYFAQRPRESQLSAWASDQSQPTNEGGFEARLALVVDRFDDGVVPRPPHWGGYRVVPRSIELWQEGPYRRHRRDRYDQTPSGWRRTLLQP